jgi:hypothetical protein
MPRYSSPLFSSTRAAKDLAGCRRKRMSNLPAQIRNAPVSPINDREQWL